MRVSWNVTAYKAGKAETWTEEIQSVMDEGQEREAVNLFPDFTYQTLEGFGGTLTEAAAYTWHQMGEKVRMEFLEACYGKDGLGYTQARMAIDSCDACLGNYSAMDQEGDEELKSFSIKRDETYILPFLRAAEKVKGESLSVMLSPWSPPPFMKTNGEKNHGGKLLEKYYGLWADYLCRFVEEYRKNDVSVKRLSVQNEPDATQIWDSCRYDAEEEKRFLKDFLYPAMKRRGLTEVDLFIWDHNKERALERTLAVIDEETRSMVKGVAFHWYSGDHFEALDMIRERFPEKKLLFSEGCVEYSRFSSADQLSNARMYGHDIAGDLNHGACAFIDWNILLNSQGGPNHVNNFCDAPMMYDVETGRLEKKLSYTYIGHFSRYLLPGSVRIGMSRYTDEIDVTAFKRPDHKLAAVLMNRTERNMPVYLRLQGQLVKLTVPGDGIGTALLELE
jgi:glucosylceramidase